ncbi:MAG: TetR/AcrR family transcriptional regulator [Halioglobus sp.]
MDLDDRAGLKKRRGRPAKSADTEDKRLALSLAALQVFGDKGFEGASLSQIARLADTDVGLIRYYFGSKQALWQGVISDLSSILGGELVATIGDSGDDPVENLRVVIRWFIMMSARRPYLSRIIAQEGNQADGRAEFLAQQLIAPFYELITNLVRAAKKRACIPDVDDRTLFFMITHGGSFPMSIPVITNEFPGDEICSNKALNLHADSIIKLIIRDEK